MHRRRELDHGSGVSGRRRLLARAVSRALNGPSGPCGRVRARATTENRDRALWPAQFVRVRLILEMLKNAMLVPSNAVQVGQNGPYAFVVRPDSTLELRQLKPGQRQDADTTVILNGLKPGETVVTRGQLQLAPG